MNGIFANYLWTMFWGSVFWIFWIMWFFHENTNIDVFVFMFDLRMINMSSECEYDWYWKISACSTEYEACDSFASLTRHHTSYSGSAGWYFRYQSIQLFRIMSIPTTFRLFLVLTSEQIGRWLPLFTLSLWQHQHISRRCDRL